MAYSSSMNTVTILVPLLVLILQTSLATSRNVECNDRDNDLVIPDQMRQGIKKCAQQVGVKSITDLTPDKFPCFSKCMMEDGGMVREAHGLIDKNGKIQEDVILAEIDEAAPADPETKAAYRQALEGCINNHGKNIDPVDPTCRTYVPFAMCAAKVAMEIYSESMFATQ